MYTSMSVNKNNDCNYSTLNLKKKERKTIINPNSTTWDDIQQAVAAYYRLVCIMYAKWYFLSVVFVMNSIHEVQTRTPAGF